MVGRQRTSPFARTSALVADHGPGGPLEPQDVRLGYHRQDNGTNRSGFRINPRCSMATRRKSFIVHPPIQFGYAGIVIWLMFNLALVIGAATYLTTMDAILTEIELVGGKAFNVYEVMARTNGVLTYRIGILFLILIVMSGLFEIYFLHRIVGPLYAIERRLLAVEGGEPFTPIVLRKKDYFHSLAGVVNRLQTTNRARQDAVTALLVAAEAHPEFAPLVARARELDG